MWEKVCVCLRPMNPADLYVNCDECHKWYHPECVGVDRKNIEKLQGFTCDNCKRIKQKKRVSNTTKYSINKT